MTYTKRFDGRKFDQLRPIEAKVGVVKRANGSAMFKIGDTIAIAAVYGPRKLYPSFLQEQQQAKLRCLYDMVSFSVTDRKRPGPSRRSTEISMVTEQALLPILDLSKYPGSVVDVFIYILQADAGTRCAGICAASMALADAGIPMKDLVVAISAGKIGGKICLDLNKEEEDHPEGATDIPIAILPREGKISLLQLDGNIKREELIEAINLVKKGSQEVYDIQKQALKQKYGGKK